MENTMLIVDDTEINREILQLLFHDRYAVLEAENGREAMEVLESCKGNVDIILLDLMMPGLDGFGMLEKIKTNDDTRNIPVVVITSSGSAEDQVKAFDLGANDYVNKPFIPEIVVSRVNNVMASHRRVTSIEKEAEELKVKSELDQMTGLYNKTTFEHEMDIELMGHSDQLDALILIDIDNFKSVNDTSGHLAGDHTIRIVADLISGLFRKTDIVGRIGGDEFAVGMINVPSESIVRDKVNELIQIMKYKPNLTIPENVSLSIGFACNNRNLVTYESLFECADEALYTAKNNGKARYHEYGKEEYSIETDTRPAALLVSRNRGVCSVIQAMMPAAVRVVEALELEDIKRIKEKEKEKIVLTYADISDLDMDYDAYWAELKSHEWIQDTQILGVCTEGNLEQYKSAMEAGVVDILTAPIEKQSFKRRTIDRLTKLGIAEVSL